MSEARTFTWKPLWQVDWYRPNEAKPFTPLRWFRTEEEARAYVRNHDDLSVCERDAWVDQDGRYVDIPTYHSMTVHSLDGEVTV